jgi:hypothetical protein
MKHLLRVAALGIFILGFTSVALAKARGPNLTITPRPEGNRERRSVGATPEDRIGTACPVVAL